MEAFDDMELCSPQLDLNDYIKNKIKKHH